MHMRQLKNDQNYLSRSITNCLKGIFAILVLFHHLYQYSGILKNSFIGIIFQLLGYLSVAMFFFFSGFGLMLSYQKKGNDYITQFLKNRIIPFYIIYLFLTLIYAGYGVLIDNEITLNEILNSIFFIDPIITMGWYLQIIFFFYIIFYIIFRFLKTRQMTAMFLCLLIYCAICMIFSFRTTIYESSFAFLLGMFWALEKEKIDGIFSEYKKFVVIASFVLFCITIIGQAFDFHSYVTVMIKMFSAVVFVALTMFAVAIVCSWNPNLINNKINQGLGKISFEIYVSQGLFLTLFHSDLIYIHNPYTYSLIVIVCTILFSVVLYPLFRLIYSVFRKI